MHGIGVVGLGVIGRRLIEGFKSNPDFRVIAGYDPSAVEVDIVRVESIEALLRNPEIDCIYIATPPATHETLIEATAQAGKAIFCEKPLTLSSASARVCMTAVADAGVLSAVNFPFATAPAAIRLMELVETERLGQDLSASLTVRFKTWPRDWQHGASGWLAGTQQGGFTREVVSHFVFLALRLFGSGVLAEHSLERGPQGSETRVRARLQFERVSLTIDGAVEGDIDDLNRFEIIGSRGSAVLSDWYRLQHADGDIEPSRPDAGQIRELSRLLSRQPHRLATFEEAAAVVNIIEAILR